MKYAVEQRYYDNGFIDVHIRKVPDMFVPVFHENNAYDLYIDVFDTEFAMEEFLKEIADDRGRITTRLSRSSEQSSS